MDDLTTRMASAADCDGHVIVEEMPKLDLDLYIQNYEGPTRFDRLFLIGRTCAPLCVEALKAAITESKQGKDTQRYRDAVEYFQKIAPNHPEAHLDRAWVERTDRSNKAETQRLEAQLKGYKNNLVKDSIRMGHEDLGQHLESIGDLNGASEAYARMKADISTPKHILQVQKHLVRVAIQRREWGTVEANLGKMLSSVNPSATPENKPLQPYVTIGRGIALMGQGQYRQAALSILTARSGPETARFNDLASPNDAAVYGGLLSLATMDRSELQKHVLDNSQFRAFLELETHIRRAVSQFVMGRYSTCLATLEAYRSVYLLDVHLQKHVPAIFSQIRTKCIVHFMQPFSCVTLESLASSFGSTMQSVEDELATMIREGMLQTRINAIDKFVTKVGINPRAKMQKTALHTAKQYERDAIDRIRRMSIAAADLEVKGLKANKMTMLDASTEVDALLEE